jgi:hypothetical protein
MVREYVAGIVELQVIVAVPLEAKDVLVSELQLSPEGAVALSVSVLVNACMRPTVMVDVEDAPTFAFAVGDVAIVKSGGIPNVKEVVVV